MDAAVALVSKLASTRMGYERTVERGVTLDHFSYRDESRMILSPSGELFKFFGEYVAQYGEQPPYPTVIEKFPKFDFDLHEDPLDALIDRLLEDAGRARAADLWESIAPVIGAGDRPDGGWTELFETAHAEMGKFEVGAVAGGHTWTGLDLIALGADPPAPPSISELLYPGTRILVSGEFESGKSWLMVAIAADELRAGRGVIWIDTDDMGPSALLERLRGFKITDEQLRELFMYVRPEERFSASARLHLVAELTKRKGRLVVFDAFNATMALEGLNPESTTDVEYVWKELVDPFKHEGAAVALPDHVVKAKDGRGRYSYGSERKATGADVHIGMTSLSGFKRGVGGKAVLTIHKDRPGFLRQSPPGAFVLESEPFVKDPGWTWRFEADDSRDEAGKFQPTIYMERVSQYLERRGTPAYRSNIEKNVTGKNDHIRTAIERLVEQGYAIEIPDSHGRSSVEIVKPFRREADDE
jgi:AAA domain